MPERNETETAVTALCRRWSREATPLEGPAARMAFFRDRLPGLLRDRTLWGGILAELAGGGTAGEGRGEAIFENEVVLYRDPARVFSLRLYLFGPGDRTPIHDHSSWGVSGPALGELEWAPYRLEAPPARLAALPPRRLSPGDVATTLPLEAGIHRTGSPGPGSVLMVSVYGTPLRRLFLNFYAPEAETVRRVFPARLMRKRLAARMLEEWGSSG